MGASKGLGKGLQALIADDFDQSLLLNSDDRIQKLFISQIHPNREQPRKKFEQTSLDELATSIKRFGILQPLIVTPRGDDYEIIAGERRWRAAQIAGLKQVPTIVRASQELEKLEIALIENVQRVDLTPLEQAISIERLHQQFNFSYTQLAVRLGKAPSTVNNIVRLLQLPADARDALQSGQISEGHARAILSLKDMSLRQAELLALIIKYGWSVRQAEQFANSSKTGQHDSKQAKQRVASETKETRQLSNILQTPVSLKRVAHGGRLEIHFKTDDELQSLVDRFLNS